MHDESLRKHSNEKLKLEQNHTSALLYVSIKQNSLKILIYLALFLQRFDVLVSDRNPFPQSRIAAFQTLDKIDNLDNLLTFDNLLSYDFI